MEANDIALDKIHKRLEALEAVHSRYCGPRGPAGPEEGRGGTAAMEEIRREKSATHSGHISTNSVRKSTPLRADLHAVQGALCRELRELYDQYAEQLGNIYGEQAAKACEDAVRKS